MLLCGGLYSILHLSMHRFLCRWLVMQAVAGVIARHPAVLCYSVEGRLRPFVDCLVGEVKLPAEQVRWGRRACWECCVILWTAWWGR